MSERLLRGVYPEQIECARNDNVSCAITVHGRCHCKGLFRSNSPAFIKEIWLLLCCARYKGNTCSGEKQTMVPL
ncbi:MAG: hypothetical protein BROFUL_03265 [Candidatus Brocadia fulgida]|uniref:Uncharacterized protein n=1 Tax=Candidatus Brocadia fulgida TaxID=380242 RepID=A0A0M2UQ83_9BACT|nr:MAG: hypothetical protein BROFUL_03265 [Candidatus Brocadia fulgida]